MVENRRAPGYYGAKVEAWVLDEYGLERSYEPVNGVRMDAIDPDSETPVEIKAVARNRRGGRPDETRFKVWRDQHESLKRADGCYVFVEYQLRSNGIAVHHSRALRASAISINWYGTTQPRGQEQAEIPARQLFD
ncbi:hypothetical protein [Halovenus marina]|uniref:hypothetical protein n=1 Tax=Halovenus marina TaxID=3396621 RepID=UPI003F564E9B